jgi:hypothetical protein
MSLSISKPSSSRLKSTYRKEDFTAEYGKITVLTEIGLNGLKFRDRIPYWQEA